MKEENNIQLKVAFDDPEHGWIGLRVQAGEEVFEEAFSYIYNSFEDLATGLEAVHEGREAKVIWQSEPREYELVFAMNDALVDLQICEYPDHARDGRKPIQVHLHALGTFEQIGRPFWKAVRDLQGRFSQEELTRRWGRNFPGQEFDRLSQVLKPVRPER